jgi:hypothetical protein
MIIIFLLCFINDILETPQESMKKFLFIIMFTLGLSYICNYYIITKYNVHPKVEMDSSKIGDKELNQEITDKANSVVSEGVNYYYKMFISFLVSCGIFLVMGTILFFIFRREDKYVGNKLYESFINAMKKNQSYLLYFAIYFFIIIQIFRTFNINTHLTDILNPCIIGGFLIFFIFCFIIFICKKFKVINNLQYLNTFIILGSLLVYFIIFGIYIFMSSLNEICTNTDIVVKKPFMEEILLILIIISILIILWYDDTRDWKWIGYFLFLIVSIFNIACFFYFNGLYPNLTIPSLWLMIEWLIILFTKNQSKNSIHYIFMK